MFRVLSPRWRKVVRELWSNRARTSLVVASIAVGIFAVGTVQHLRTVILAEMQQVYDDSNASVATLFVNGVDDDALTALRRMPEVADAQGRSSVGVKVLVGDKWQNMSIIGIDDFADVRINRISLVYSLVGNPEFSAELSRWPGKEEIVIERGSFDAKDALPADLRVGDTLTLETDGGKKRTVKVVGTVYDPNGFPAAFTGTASGYADLDTISFLGGTTTYSQIELRANGTSAQLRDKEYVSAVAEAAKSKLEKAGYVVARVAVPDPGELALQSLFDSLALLLTPLGLLALILSGFLVINTIAALMSQQVQQIGMMKAIGARRYQIVLLYLGAVLIYSLTALAAAIPLTMFVAGGLVKFLGGFINVDFPRWSLPSNVLLIELGVGILVPLAAAIIPVFRGTAVTVREAISDYGTGTAGKNEDWLIQLLASIRGMSRPMQLSFRNTFRRKGRLSLTLITLVLGGMIFMTVGSVRASLEGLIEKGLDYYQFDVQFALGREYRTAQIEKVVASLPEIAVIESWSSASATPILADGSEGDPFNLTALPADSVMVKPTLLKGRWLLDDDNNAIVVSQNVLVTLPELQVGDTMQLKVNDKEASWIVVGIAQVLGGPPGVVPIYVNAPYYARLTSAVGQASSVQVKLVPGSSLSQDEVASILTEQLEDAGYEVASSFTIDTLRRFTGSFFDIIIYLLLAMGVLIASVGALGLMGTMSTNVLERTREIGVMRAVGASDRSVQQIVIVEGVFIGWISWLLGAMLAWPVGALLANTVGVILFQTALPYTFSGSGVVGWLASVTVLGTLASFLPAWNASRLTVREILAYQ